MSYPKIIFNILDNRAIMSKISINISVDNTSTDVTISIPIGKKLDSIISQSPTVIIKFIEIITVDTFRVTFGDGFIGDDQDHLFYYSYTLTNI